MEPWLKDGFSILGSPELLRSSGVPIVIENLGTGMDEAEKENISKVTVDLFERI